MKALRPGWLSGKGWVWVIGGPSFDTRLHPFFKKKKKKKKRCTLEKRYWVVSFIFC